MTQPALQLPTTGTLGGLAMVQGVNAALAGLASFLQGPVAPTAAALGLPNLVGVGWHDTATGTLKIRDQADTAWIVIGTLDENNKVFRASVAIADSSLRMTAAGIQANEPVTTIAANQAIGAANHFSNFVATAAVTVTLAQTATLWNGFAFAVSAQGGAVTVTPNAADKINGGVAGAALTLASGSSALFVADGAGNWWTFFQATSGGGNSPLANFNYCI